MSVFEGLGMVEEIISENELKVYSLSQKKSIIVKATREYVLIIGAELEEEFKEIIVPYDEESLIVKEI